MTTTEKYTIYQSQSGKVLHLTWGSYEDKEQDFSAALETFMETLWNNHYERAIIDYSQVRINFSPMLRRWLSEKWIPRLQQNKVLKKMGFVLGGRLAHFSIQDLMHDAGSTRFKVAYFHQLPTAEKWSKA